MSGSFYVQSEKLRSQAAAWTTRRSDVETAQADIAEGIGQGADFGYLAGANQVTEYYNEWSRAMDQALSDAAACFDYLAQALDSAANVFDGSDETSAVNAETLKGLLP